MSIKEESILAKVRAASSKFLTPMLFLEPEAQLATIQSAFR